MERALWHGVVNHIVLLLALVFLYSQLIRRWDLDTLAGKCAAGALFGGIAAVGMLFPVEFAPGILLDMRTVLLGVPSLMAGVPAAGVAVLITALIQVGQDGAALTPKLAVIFSSALLGVLFRGLRPQPFYRTHPVALYVFGLVLHAVALVFLWLLLNPAQRRLVTELSRPVLVAYPVLTLLLGRLLAQVEQRWQGVADLQKNQDFLAEIINAAGDPLFVSDRAHRLILMNDAFCALLGSTREELFGKTEVDVHPPERAAALWQRNEAVLATGADSVREERYVDADGKDRFAVTRRRRYVDRYGKSYLVGTARDVTRQKAAASSLRASEERYRAMIQQSLDAIVIVDIRNKQVLDVNEQGSRLLGYNREEFCRLTIYDIVVDTRDNIDRRLRTVLTGGELASRFLRIRKKDGRIVEVERSATVIRYGETDVLMFAARDLSAERKLQGLILKDVTMAADVQKSLIPHGFNDVLASVRTIYSSLHVVSGDIYDFGWSQDHQKFAGFILDISGHGVSSALQGIAVSAYFRELLDSPMRLDAKLKWINRRVIRYFTEATYAAAIYFEFDFSRHVLTYASAGIYGFLAWSDWLPPVVRQAGSLIGILEEGEYQEVSVPFQVGDAFYFMSDGIFDQLSRRDGLTLDDFERTVQDLQGLAESPLRKDDCTGVCVHINGRPTFPVRLELHRADEFRRLRARLRNLLAEVAGEEAGQIGIALGEALNNAARESAELQVKLALFGHRLVIRVRDAGPGFDGNGFARKLSRQGLGEAFDERLGEEGGRGIMIMLAWLDRVRYSRDGREVLLMKRLERRLDSGGDS